MTTQPLPPAPPPVPPPPPPTAPDGPRRRRWVWPLVAVLALAVGVGGGLGSATLIDDDEPATVAEESDEQSGGELDELRAEVDSLREQLDQVQGQRDDLKERLDETRAALDEAEEPTQPTDETAEPEPVEGTFTAGDFTFSAVEIREDYVGDFEVGATVTNDGAETVSYVSWTATVLLDGSPVSTLTATASEFPAGDAIDVTFIGFDDFGAWDSVEFAVDPTF
ncbi:hypothetical protein [Jiangella asiatica]|uniref:Uncharacterized protein n=1 Tax=Jiangella asiatica TaxID=2530372 RepID=A0A4R5CFC6_9ACTN|nr:hypothetical protein [Jiangella asiatica]TDD98295.1 hypothetical protein E1269_28825 [Jiangella asiatica]